VIQVLIQLSPIFLLFLFGLGMRRFGFADNSCGNRYLKVVVNIAFPLLVFTSVSRISLTSDLLLLPLLAMATVVVVGVLAYGAGRLMALEKSQLGVLLMGAMVMNLAFLYPFVSVAWGEKALGSLILLDFGNALLVLTLVYALACVFGKGVGPIGRQVGKGLLSFPPLWALLLALVVNVLGIPLPDQGLDMLSDLAQLLMFLVPYSLGLYFSLQGVAWLPVAVGLVLRSGLGLALGLSWVMLFDLQGLEAAVVILACAAPVGFNSLVYAVREGLDARYAATQASLSVLLGMIYVPVLMWLLKV